MQGDKLVSATIGQFWGKFQRRPFHFFIAICFDQQETKDLEAVPD
jgi:hypothetical protein